MTRSAWLAALGAALLAVISLANPDVAPVAAAITVALLLTAFAGEAVAGTAGIVGRDELVDVGRFQPTAGAESAELPRELLTLSNQLADAESDRPVNIFALSSLRQGARQVLRVRHGIDPDRPEGFRRAGVVVSPSLHDLLVADLDEHRVTLSTYHRILDELERL